MDKLHYVIYRITNMLNGMIYIGQHTTTNPNDDYMGSGKYIVRAIKKYGVKNFKKEILCECSSQEELNAIRNCFRYSFTIDGNGSLNYLDMNTQVRTSTIR